MKVEEKKEAMRKWLKRRNRGKRKQSKDRKGETKKVKGGRKSSGMNRQEVIQKAGRRRVRVAMSNDSFSLDDS